MKKKANTKGPLESLKLKNHCEMCGVSERHVSSVVRDIVMPLEPAFNPSGQPKTLCRDCRIGSAELIRERWFAAEKLDSSDVATILAALRLFQREYEDCDSVHIADAWPMHFAVSGEGDELVVTPQ